MNITQTVYDHWMELRAAGRLDEVLPSARAYKSITKAGEVDGYDTCEHQISRRVLIPGSGPNGGNGVAGLVETYFSIRHHNGWGHNLHVHVVEAKNETLQVSHLAHLFRCVAGLRYGLSVHGVMPRSKNDWMHRCLYVHGALLGPSASGDVLMAEAMLDHQYNHLDNGMFQPSIRVGCVTVHPVDGVTIKRVQADGRYATDNLIQRIEDAAEEERLRQTVDKLMDASPMWSEWLTAYKAEEEELYRKRRVVIEGES